MKETNLGQLIVQINLKRLKSSVLIVLKLMSFLAQAALEKSI